MCAAGTSEQHKLMYKDQHPYASSLPSQEHLRQAPLHIDHHLTPSTVTLALCKHLKLEATPAGQLNGGLPCKSWQSGDLQHCV